MYHQTIYFVDIFMLSNSDFKINKCPDVDACENRATPKLQTIHFNNVFDYKPSILGYPFFFGNTHVIYINKNSYLVPQPWASSIFVFRVRFCSVRGVRGTNFSRQVTDDSTPPRRLDVFFRVSVLSINEPNTKEGNNGKLVVFNGEIW